MAAEACRERSIGFSPCPNDTFIFCGLVHGRIPLAHVRLAPPLLKDVATLNSWALQARLDVTKLSCHALGHVLDRYTMLASGAALGRGCGPLLVTRAGHRQGRQGGTASWRIAIPGQYTTAALLLRLFLPGHQETVVMPFDTIMDAVATGRVDAGVIIHESRFTYQHHGLVCVQDLGEWWEQDTGLPIPLGCIAARKGLAQAEIQEIEQGIAASARWAAAHPEQCLGYIHHHAQELDEQVIADHIGLYVNEFSLDLGHEGREAVQELLRRGQVAGLLPQPPSLAAAH